MWKKRPVKQRKSSRECKAEKVKQRKSKQRKSKQKVKAEKVKAEKVKAEKVMEVWEVEFLLKRPSRHLTAAQNYEIQQHSIFEMN
ncbi:hypothetical protein TNCV_4948831 [Trichonephila clavipes]|nr:hypothetical protein TNCV_4948831 [Trichonephila clavipes]